MSLHFGRYMSGNGLSKLAPPEWLCEHPEIRNRGIQLEIPLKPFCVWRTNYVSPPSYAVKLVPPESEEVDIYEELHRLNPASPNHTLPCDIIRSDTEQPFLIMPCLEKIWEDQERWRWGPVPLLDFFHQVLEGLDFLHQRHIAHMDIYDGQILFATQRHVAFHKGLQPGKVYIIDFDASKHLDKGPGYQHAIELPECNCEPPLSMTRFDPYSWDVYCTGMLFEDISEFIHGERPLPWFVWRYIRWLIGHERGCTTVCHCRPTARRARQVLTVIQCVVGVWEGGSRLISRVCDLGKTRPAQRAD